MSIRLRTPAAPAGPSTPAKWGLPRTLGSGRQGRENSTGNNLQRVWVVRYRLWPGRQAALAIRHRDGRFLFRPCRESPISSDYWMKPSLASCYTEDEMVDTILSVALPIHFTAQPPEPSSTKDQKEKQWQTWRF